MESKETSGPTYYNGTYTHGVDDKRRLSVPARWRPEVAGTELTLILWPKEKAGACIRVLPPHKMADLMKDIDAMANSDAKKTFLKRFIGSRSLQVTVDTAGRICLPDDMAKEAAISDKAVLVGLLDRFEIWSPARYETLSQADKILAQDAFSIME
jgi:MraZ protein